ncbi:hypothetical protein AB1Y20_007896 [Prymnesium parvum]|uniref:NB-ARC domain-containing protein n=1 Tax=Prymnesium parvum TaxID=97485 RepID=A0AB34IV87_PRYPA
MGTRLLLSREAAPAAAALLAALVLRRITPQRHRLIRLLLPALLAALLLLRRLRREGLAPPSSTPPPPPPPAPPVDAPPAVARDALTELLDARAALRLVLVHCSLDSDRAAHSLAAAFSRLAPRADILLAEELPEAEAIARVHGASAVVFVHSKAAASSARVLLSLLAAVDGGVPIVGAHRAAAERLVDAAALFGRLDSRLATDVAAHLRSHHVSLSHCAWRLSEQLQHMRSFPLDPAEALLREALCAAALPPPQTAWEEWLRHRDRETAAEPAETPPPPVPAGVPCLPAAYDANSSSRATLITEVKLLLTSREHTRGVRKVALRGGGGAGKTTIASAIVRDDEVRRPFDAVAWLTVGEAPNTTQLLRQLLAQWDPGASSALSGDELVVALSRATRGRTLLLALDDLWRAEDAELLYRLDEGTPSACIVSTRISDVLKGAVELQVGKMDLDEAIDLLLRVGGVAAQYDATPPPAAAAEAVELCGRLPLLVAMAGSMLACRAKEDWPWLLATLRKDHMRALRRTDDLSEVPTAHAEMRSVEERVVMQSLDVLVVSAKRNGPLARGLFLHLAAFAEDIAVPIAVIDALAPMIARESGVPLLRKPPSGNDWLSTHGAIRQRHRSVAATSTRMCLLMLLRHSLVQGSIALGVSLHDIVRAYALARAAEAEGGMRAMQRRVLRALLEALGVEHAAGAGGRTELSKYAQLQLAHHVRGARDGGAPLREDALLVDALLGHADESVRRLVAEGVGEEAVVRAAEASEARGELEAAASLWYAASGTSARGGELRRRACACAMRVSPPSRDSVRVEANAYLDLFAKTKGIQIGSEEHSAAMARLEMLRMAAGQGQGVPQLALCFDESRFLLRYQQFCHAEGEADGGGVVGARRELVEVLPPLRLKQCLLQSLDSDEGAVKGFALLFSAAFTRVHLHADYDWESEFGEGGAYLRALLRKYSFEFINEKAKAAIGRDPAMCGMVGSYLLLRWCDVNAARTDWRRTCDAWREVHLRVAAGKLAWSRLDIDLMDMRATRAVAFAAGFPEVAAELFEYSLEAAALCGEEGAAHLEANTLAVGRWMSTWKLEAGCSAEGMLLMARASGALFRGEAGGGAVRAWLPPAAECLALARRERAWDVWLLGAQHPSAACALVYEAQGDAAAAAELAGALLQVLRQPLTLVELRRLRARCGGDAAAELGAAAEVARCAGYVWLEVRLAAELYALERSRGRRGELAEALGRVSVPLGVVTPFLGHGLDAEQIVAERAQWGWRLRLVMNRHAWRRRRGTPVHEGLLS